MPQVTLNTTEVLPYYATPGRLYVNPSGLFDGIFDQLVLLAEEPIFHPGGKNPLTGGEFGPSYTLTLTALNPHREVATFQWSQPAEEPLSLVL